MSQTYTAIEMLYNETVHETIYGFMRLASNHKLLFSSLDVLDVITIGPRKFVRCKIVGIANLNGSLQDFRESRAMVAFNGSNYRLYLPGGREATVPTARMHMVALSNYKKTYRGTKSDLWEAQFVVV
jgi:hypothetical protein